MSSLANTNQGRNRLNEKMEKMMGLVNVAVHVLNHISRASDGLQRWRKLAFKSLREALYPFMSYPEKYPLVDGDIRLGDNTNVCSKKCSALTAGKSNQLS